MACITLLSDFGLQDTSVSAAKGILMQHIPHLQIIDLSHNILPFHAAQAAYLLASAYRSFPAGTCHLILSDVFSEKPSRLLLTEYSGQFFLSADNGILPSAFRSGYNSWLYFEMNGDNTFSDWLHAAGKATGSLQSAGPSSLSLSTFALRPLSSPKNRLSADGVIDCEVVHIDNYGNAVLNITKNEFEALAAGRSFRIQFKMVEDIDILSVSYADVREGYKLCRFNSNGHLEICINRGNAASLFGLRLGGKNNDIKIYFE